MGFIESKLHIHPQTGSCLILVTLRIWTLTIKSVKESGFRVLVAHVVMWGL